MNLSNMDLSKMIQWRLYPVPTTFPKRSGKDSLLRAPTIPRRSPFRETFTEMKLLFSKQKAKLQDFFFLDNLHAPLPCSFKRLSKSI